MCECECDQYRIVTYLYIVIWFLHTTARCDDTFSFVYSATTKETKDTVEQEQNKMSPFQWIDPMNEIHGKIFINRSARVHWLI